VAKKGMSPAVSRHSGCFFLQETLTTFVAIAIVDECISAPHFHGIWCFLWQRIVSQELEFLTTRLSSKVKDPVKVPGYSNLLAERLLCCGMHAV
jgi:hypothetical protein